jgi:N-acyl-D-amino-acid deacylase
MRVRVLSCLLTAFCWACETASPPGSLVIRDVTVVDGTGAPAFVASVRIGESRIIDLDAEAIAGSDEVIDGRGLVLAPGFIDSHSHHDRGLEGDPGVLAAVSQGITTIVVGQDGGSAHPVADLFSRLEADPAAVNVASYAGHNTLRALVMGEDYERAASEEEIEAMKARLAADLDAGALGLSTGLEYDPGLYATTDEVLALAREASAAGGRYITHMRSEDRALRTAVEEALRIGEEARIPVQISHFKLAQRSLWGQAERFLSLLTDARSRGIDVTIDVYPYTYWQSTMTVIFPDRDFEDQDAFVYALENVVPPEQLLISRYDPEPSYEGLTLAEVAEREGTNPVAAYMDLIRRSMEARAAGEPSGESVIATSMHPDDVRALMAWDHAVVSSDGASAGGHPRGFGAFPRVLGLYAREEAVLGLEEAVHKMTGLSARALGLDGLGVLEEGAIADLVLFDPTIVEDRATTDDPHATAAGIRRVWVSGVEVYRDGAVTGARPGRLIRRRADRRPVAYRTVGEPGTIKGPGIEAGSA